MTFDITVDLGANLDTETDSAELERLAAATLAAEQVADGAAVAIVLVGDAEMQALNQQYRGIDGPTDVLAFAAQEGELMVLAPDAPRELGDVVISLETARRQAEALGHSLDAELALLVVHGCLHLVGHDHDEQSAQAYMWLRQAAILAGCGYPDVGAERPEMYEQAPDA